MSAHYAMGRADAAWLRMDRPTNLMVVNAVLWLDTTPDWDAVRAIYAERIVGRFPRFSQRPAGGRSPLSGPRWEDIPDFDPAPHFHRVALPRPGDAAALQEVVGDLASQPLPHDRPLWEVHLIEGHGSGAAILTRIHHAVADGIALARVMLTLTGDRDDGIGDEPARRDGALAPIGALARMGRMTTTALIDAVRDPSRVRPAVARGRRDSAALAKLLMPMPESSRALKGEPRIAHRVGWTSPYDLWRVKAAARALDATVNDVLVAAVAGALRSHVVAAGGRPDPVHALVPLNLRPLDRPVPRSLGNRFGLVLVTLPLDGEDPLERLWAVKREMRAIKRSDEGAIAFGILDVMGQAPARIEQLLIDYFTGKGSLVLTNVPGPRRRVSLAGVPIEGVLVWAPCSGSLEMSVSLFSYAGKVTIGFLTDAGLVPEPQGLADQVRSELLVFSRLARRLARDPSPGHALGHQA